MFLTIDGTPLNPDSLTADGRRYIRSANVDKPGACHIYRHTMATLMHNAGADIHDIQAILGHAKLDTTQTYTRVSLEKLLDTPPGRTRRRSPSWTAKQAAGTARILPSKSLQSRQRNSA